MVVPQNPDSPLDRGIRPLHLLLLIICGAAAFPLALYALLMIFFLLTPGSLD